jgi:hypothetical protein
MLPPRSRPGAAVFFYRVLRGAEASLEDRLKRVRMAWVVSVWLGSFGVLAGCTQGRGETCQVDRDCSSGLICCRVAMVDASMDMAPSMTVRGSCYAKDDKACGLAGQVNTPRLDGGADAQMSMPQEDAGN